MSRGPSCARAVSDLTESDRPLYLFGVSHHLIHRPAFARWDWRAFAASRAAAGAARPGAPADPSDRTIAACSAHRGLGHGPCGWIPRPRRARCQGARCRRSRQRFRTMLFRDGSVSPGARCGSRADPADRAVSARAPSRWRRDPAPAKRGPNSWSGPRKLGLLLEVDDRRRQPVFSLPWRRPAGR